MDVHQIKGMGRPLGKFLSEFEDCFGRSEPRGHLRTYVQGQLSNLLRKSVEPIALSAKVAPRTLQGFFSYLSWDEQHLRDRVQWIVARDHAHPQAIGVIDESGNPKKGKHTAGVQRQWCGNVGKTDNCVVGVHLGYVAGDFQCLLDSDLFLPKAWAHVHQQLREKKLSPESVPDGRTGSPGGLCAGASPSVSALCPDRRIRAGGRPDPAPSAEKSPGTSLSLENNPAKAQDAGDRCSQTQVLCTG